MYDLTTPQEPIGTLGVQNFDLHVLVGLPTHSTFLQLASQEKRAHVEMRFLARCEANQGSSKICQSIQSPPSVPVSLRILGLLHRPLILLAVLVPSPELDGDSSR